MEWHRLGGGSQDHDDSRPGAATTRVRNGVYLLALCVTVLISLLSWSWGAAALGLLVVAYVSHWMESMLKSQAEIMQRLDRLERQVRATPAMTPPPLRVAAPDEVPMRVELPH